MLRTCVAAGLRRNCPRQLPTAGWLTNPPVIPCAAIGCEKRRREPFTSSHFAGLPQTGPRNTGFENQKLLFDLSKISLTVERSVRRIRAVHGCRSVAETLARSFSPRDLPEGDGSCLIPTRSSVGIVAVVTFSLLAGLLIGSLGINSLTAQAQPPFQVIQGPPLKVPGPINLQRAIDRLETKLDGFHPQE